jgi:hypothetical protein
MMHSALTFSPSLNATISGTEAPTLSGFFGLSSMIPRELCLILQAVTQANLSAATMGGLVQIADRFHRPP